MTGILEEIKHKAAEDEARLCAALPGRMGMVRIDVATVQEALLPEVDAKIVEIGYDHHRGEIVLFVCGPDVPEGTHFRAVLWATCNQRKSGLSEISRLAKLEPIAP